MPWNGQSSFLQDHRTADVPEPRCVSMPYNGQSSFLPDTHPIELRTTSVSMPYNGQSSFLHGTANGSVPLPYVCQCPITGNHHFYNSYLRHCIASREGCQCPITGNHHFYFPHMVSGAEIHCLVSVPYNGQSSFLRK